MEQKEGKRHRKRGSSSIKAKETPTINHCAESNLLPELLRVIELQVAKSFPELDGDDPDLRGEVFWVEAANKVVSVLVINFDSRQPTLWNVCTLETERRKGYSSLLLQAAQQWICSTKEAPLGLTLTVLPSNHAAIQMYENHGFLFVEPDSAKLAQDELHNTPVIMRWLPECPGS